MGMTDLSCGMKCLKYLLFVVNFIVWACGIAVLVVGIYSRVKAGDWSDLMKEAAVVDAANLLIAAGAIVMVIGFVGCCGAIRQNRPLLVVYSILLILIFVLEIAGGIYAAVKKDDVIKSLQEGFQETMKNSYGLTSKADQGLTDSVDWFQKNVECCGSKGPSSWNDTRWGREQLDMKSKNKTYLLVPDSCCKSSGCNANAKTYTDLKNTAWPMGCIEESKAFLDSHMKELVGAGVGLAFVQLIGIIFAICLCRAIGKESV
jgi:hypothetical protein